MHPFLPAARNFGAPTPPAQQRLHRTALDGVGAAASIAALGSLAALQHLALLASLQVGFGPAPMLSVCTPLPAASTAATTDAAAAAATALPLTCPRQFAHRLAPAPAIAAGRARHRRTRRRRRAAAGAAALDQRPATVPRGGYGGPVQRAAAAHAAVEPRACRRCGDAHRAWLSEAAARAQVITTTALWHPCATAATATCALARTG